MACTPSLPHWVVWDETRNKLPLQRSRQAKGNGLDQEGYFWFIHWNTPWRKLLLELSAKPFWFVDIPYIIHASTDYWLVGVGLVWCGTLENLWPVLNKRAYFLMRPSVHIWRSIRMKDLKWSYSRYAWSFFIYSLSIEKNVNEPLFCHRPIICPIRWKPITSHNHTFRTSCECKCYNNAHGLS